MLYYIGTITCLKLPPSRPNIDHHRYTVSDRIRIHLYQFLNLLFALISLLIFFYQTQKIDLKFSRRKFGFSNAHALISTGENKQSLFPLWRKRRGEKNANASQTVIERSFMQKRAESAADIHTPTLLDCVTAFLHRESKQTGCVGVFTALKALVFFSYPDIKGAD